MWNMTLRQFLTSLLGMTITDSKNMRQKSFQQRRGVWNDSK